MSELKENTKTVCKLLIITATSRCVTAFLYWSQPTLFKTVITDAFFRSCRDTNVFSAMYWGLYGGIESFFIIKIGLIKMANYAKKLKASFWQNERWQKHKSTWFDFVYPFAFKNQY